jgi:hypothetical protein
LKKKMSTQQGLASSTMHIVLDAKTPDLALCQIGCLHYRIS